MDPRDVCDVSNLSFLRPGKSSILNIVINSKISVLVPIAFICQLLFCRWLQLQHYPQNFKGNISEAFKCSNTKDDKTAAALLCSFK